MLSKIVFREVTTATPQCKYILPGISSGPVALRGLRVLRIQVTSSGVLIVRLACVEVECGEATLI